MITVMEPPQLLPVSFRTCRLNSASAFPDQRILVPLKMKPRKLISLVEAILLFYWLIVSLSFFRGNDNYWPSPIDPPGCKQRFAQFPKEQKEIYRDMMTIKLQIVTQHPIRFIM